MTIFAGETEFTTPRPFEAKSARVKLSFTVEADEDAGVVADQTGRMARQLAERMISDTPSTEQLGVAVTEVPKRPRTRATPPAPEPTGERVPDKVTDEGAVVVAPPADPFAAGAPVPSEPASAPVSEAASNDPSKSSAVEPITDEYMLGAIVAKNGEVRNTQLINDLIVTFTGDPLIKVYAIKQEQRQEFLTKLAALA